MMKTLFGIAPIAGLLFAAVAVADGKSSLAPIGGPVEIAFGQSPEQTDALVAADWIETGCSRERLFHLADAAQHGSLADVGLVGPGLLYRFVDNRLYAIQAEYSPGAGSFARLRDYLTEKYGTPSESASWQDAPSDSYVYRNRMYLVGWHGPARAQVIWLTSYDAGGSIVMLDNRVAQWGVQRIGTRCDPLHTELSANAFGPTAHSATKQGGADR